ncbi:ATP phosphoribosyltransferase regulatory subunit [Synechococcus sp. M16CYN]|uniref:ATP phosphoribosyltransferase regulatory subunit n=1 Tax=Synechococcus sp. M16CYN TaxID=3103139 RepID=UPI00324C3B21
MALQPAAGAKDLNPRQVETNRNLTERLARVFRLWGYDEVSPPRIERMKTLMAGGAIASRDIVRLVADDPLGLRPEMTASIARAASTRLANRPRPMRLWASGTVFQSRAADEGGQRIEENLQSSVELFGVAAIEAEMELLSLLMASVAVLNLGSMNCPRLLLGHTRIMELILQPFKGSKRDAVRSALIHFDRLAIETMELSVKERQVLLTLLDCRGTPEQVLRQLQTFFGQQPVFNDLSRLCTLLRRTALEQGIVVQLDPSFQPRFKLYTGWVFQLVCNGRSAPVVIARGGRYDDLVQRCGAPSNQAFGAGFSLAIDPIRELMADGGIVAEAEPDVIVVYSSQSNLEEALERQRGWHESGRGAVIELHPIKSVDEAQLLAQARGKLQLDWIGP